MAARHQISSFGGRRAAWGLAACALLLATIVAALLARARQPSDPVVATVPLGSFPGEPAVDDATGHAFIANSLDTNVEMVDSATGAVLRTITVGSNGGAHPESIRVDTAEHRAFVATDDGLLSTLDTRSGALLRASVLGGSVQLLALDQRRHLLYAANLDSSTLSTVDAQGTLRRTTSTGSLPQALAVDDRTDRVLIAGQDDGTLTVLNGGTGAVQAVRHVGTVQGMLVDAQLGLVFLSSAQGTGLKALDARRGGLRWAVPLARRGTVPQAILLAADDQTGHLCAASGTQVRLIDARSGRVLRRVEVGSRVTALAEDPLSRSCLVLAQGPLDGLGHLLGRGDMVVLDSGSGTVRRTIAVGAGPQSISVDVRRRRALVINTGLNPDGTLARPRPPSPTWVQRLPLVGSWLPSPSPTTVPPDGRGSLTVIDLARL